MQIDISSIVEKSSGVAGREIVPFGPRPIPQALGGEGSSRCTCLASATNDGGATGNFDVYHVYGITFSGRLPEMVSDSSILSVSNPDGWAWSANARMRIEKNETTDLWEVTFAQCPS